MSYLHKQGNYRILPYTYYNVAQQNYCDTHIDLLGHMIDHSIHGSHSRKLKHKYTGTIHITILWIDEQNYIEQEHDHHHVRATDVCSLLPWPNEGSTFGRALEVTCNETKLARSRELRFVEDLEKYFLSVRIGWKVPD